jgi:hypothetical protein
MRVIRTAINLHELSPKNTFRFTLAKMKESTGSETEIKTRESEKRGPSCDARQSHRREGGSHRLEVGEDLEEPEEAPRSSLSIPRGFSLRSDGPECQQDDREPDRPTRRVSLAENHGPQSIQAAHVELSPADRPRCPQAKRKTKTKSMCGTTWAISC